jgi:hypothetical protein
MAAAETFAEFLDRYGRPEGSNPVIDLDAVDQQRQSVIVSFAGGTKKAIVQFMGLAAGTSNEHLCLDVHAFVDDLVARSSVFGLEDGARYEGFTDDAPGRSHGRPAVRGVTVLIGAQTPATVPAGISSAFDPDELEALVITAAEAVGSGMEALSRRQRDLAMRAYQLLVEALGD